MIRLIIGGLLLAIAHAGMVLTKKDKEASVCPERSSCRPDWRFPNKVPVKGVDI